jgi:3-hydroxybutyryl-CoA dehydrogenase
MDPMKLKRALVMGAGIMGHSIAQVFAQAGVEVDLMDLDDKILGRAMTLIEANLQTLARAGRVSQGELEAIQARIHPTSLLPASPDGIGFAIEAVSEVAEVKKKVFSQLEEFCPEDAVLASNTSALDIFSVAQIKKPERLLVTHWFAPPHIIPLVEVVPGPTTSPAVVEFAAKLMERLGKKPVVMKAFVPSFIVNRIQNNIYRAVWEILEKGWATAEQIDLAVKLSLGIRLPIVGVAQSLDFTGLDLVFDMMKSRGSVNPLVEEKVKRGHLGAKSSRGIYDYGGKSETEILKKRDERYLKVLDHLEKIKAFEPI